MINKLSVFQHKYDGRLYFSHIREQDTFDRKRNEKIPFLSKIFIFQKSLYPDIPYNWKTRKKYRKYYCLFGDLSK